MSVEFTKAQARATAAAMKRDWLESVRHYERAECHVCGHHLTEGIPCLVCTLIRQRGEALAEIERLRAALHAIETASTGRTYVPGSGAAELARDALREPA